MLKDKIKNALDWDQRIRDRCVTEWLNSIQPGKIIDIGAGGGPYAQLATSLGFTYKSQDFCQLPNHLIHEGKYKSIDYVSDAAMVPVESGFFDYVLCTEVLEHHPYPDRVVAEIARVLKVGGIVFASFPTMTPGHQRPFWFFSGFSPEWVTKVFNDNKLLLNYVGYPCNGPMNILKLLIANFSLNLKLLGNRKSFFYAALALPLNFISLILNVFSAMLLDKYDLNKNYQYGLIAIAIKK